MVLNIFALHRDYEGGKIKESFCLGMTGSEIRLGVTKGPTKRTFK